MVTVAQKAIKYLIFLTNFLIFCLSVAVIATAGYFLSNLNRGIVDTFEVPKASVAFLLAIAVFAALVSFFGCCGAVKESPCLLQTYAWIIFIILAAEFVAAIIVVRFRNDIKQIAIDGLTTGINEYQNGTEYSAIDDIQKQLKCCGIEGPRDWDEKFNGTVLPDSCCPDAGKGVECLKDSEQVFKEPCLTKFEDMFKQVSKALAGVGLAVAVIQLTAVISTCCLARAFKREYEVV